MTFNYTDISLSEFSGEVSLVLYSPSCNYYCPWCFNPDLREKEPLTFKQVKDAVDEHRDFITAVVLSGGEPLFNPNIDKILRYLESNGLKIKINSNGTVPKYNRDIYKIHHIDYFHISLKPTSVCTCIKPSRQIGLMSADLFEYSFVYSSSIFPKVILDRWIKYLNKIISLDDWWSFDRLRRPEIFTISQIQVGNCLNPFYNDCSVPTRDELLDIAKLFKRIPTKKLIIETKEYGRENVLKEVNNI